MQTTKPLEIPMKSALVTFNDHLENYDINANTKYNKHNVATLTVYEDMNLEKFHEQQ